MRGADAAAALARALSRTGAPSSDHELMGEAVPRSLRPAAVLLAVDVSGERAGVLLTKRSAQLRHHPGQIALPGGKLDRGEDARACALREAAEEVGLPTASPEVLGTLPPHVTVTGFSVTPVLALLRAPVRPVPRPGEVDEAFFVPLAHLADLGSYRQEGRAWGGRARRYWVAPYGPHYVWGATARILRGLAEAMA